MDMVELHRKRHDVFLVFYTLCSLLSATDNNGRVWDSGAHEERHSHDYRSVVRWTLKSTPGSLWPYPFKRQNPHTNSPDRSLYISLKN